MASYLMDMFSVCLCLMVVGTGSAATIKVGEQHRVKSIKTALEMAVDGDTIQVDGGVYREGNVAIRKRVALIGVNNPVIDGEKQHEPLSIFVPYVTIKGFTVKASGRSSVTDVAGIKIYNVHDVVIADNVLDDNFFGTYAQAAKT